ncbi:MAG: bacillithiol biosynthesis cysteine-adding enzyme BshC [Chryseolinea sp.]
MQLDKVSLAESHAFTPFFLDYIQEHDNLKPFYGRFPRPENFKAQIEEKEQSFPVENRKVLVDSLRKQYEGLKLSSVLEDNISKLEQSKTFTVTTGHQLNIFTGPMFFVFKIVTVINTCKRLKEQYPDYNFVPVYWMASEDHDYEEIKYFKLYGKKYTWETEQKGAVGRFNTKGLEKLATEIPGENPIFKTAYTKQKTLAAAGRYYVNELFGSMGVVTIDADNGALKAEFKKVIREDIIDQVTKPIVDKTNNALEQLGYKPQVFCRDINFFHLDNNGRNRLEKEGEGYKVVDTDLIFSKSDLESKIKNQPEQFSPNVILRPLYQEMILPNIAYVGGPAEVIYWLQLKEVFIHSKTPFPILMPRNFGMIVDHEVSRKFGKTGLALKDLFEEKNFIFNHWVLANTSHNLRTTSEQKAAGRIFEELKSRASTIDTTLSTFVAAAQKRNNTDLEKIEKKMMRAEKRLHTDRLRQIEAVKDILFPNGSLQERTDSFLNFYHKDPEFIERLAKLFDPFDFQFNILSYTE